MTFAMSEPGRSGESVPLSPRLARLSHVSVGCGSQWPFCEMMARFHSL